MHADDVSMHEASRRTQLATKRSDERHRIADTTDAYTLERDGGAADTVARAIRHAKLACAEHGFDAIALSDDVPGAQLTRCGGGGRRRWGAAGGGRTAPPETPPTPRHPP